MDIEKVPVDHTVTRWIFNAQPTALLAVLNSNTTNCTTIAWYSPMLNNPLRYGFSLHNRSFSHHLLNQTKKGSFNLLGVRFIDMITGPGFTTGWNTDKIQKFHIPISLCDNIPVVSVAFISMTFEVISVQDMGNSNWYIVEAKTVLASPQSHNNGLLSLDDPSWQPVHHIGEHEYVAMSKIQDWEQYHKYPSPNKRP